jgi:addiction module RelE/StbE family toxin
MAKEIIWTDSAKKNLKDIISYLKLSWPPNVLIEFSILLDLKIKLLSKHPYIGFKSKKYSRFRKTIITKRYLIIYSIKKDHIVILRIKHTSMK